MRLIRVLPNAGLSLLGAAAVVISTISAHAQSATFSGLGLLPGYSFSRAVGVSGDGNVVVGYSSADSNGDCSDNCQAVRWVNGGAPNSLGYLPGGNASNASAANADGSVIVGLAHATTSVHSEAAFRWVLDTSGGTMTELPLPTGHSCAGADAVSADGNTVIGTGWTCFSGAPYEAFQWTSSGTGGLGFLPGYDGRTYGSGISSDGLVVVGTACFDSSGNCEAFRLANGSMTGIGFLPGYPTSEAIATNADGSVIVGQGDNGPVRQAFRWVQNSSGGGGNISAIPFLNGGSVSFGNNVSADGSVVVGSSTSADYPNGEAFRWTATRGTESIRTLLVNAGIDMTGWALLEANAVSADGTLIVGSGIDPTGQVEAWVAVFNQGVCPQTTQQLTSCVGECNSALAHKYGDYATAAVSLGYSSVQALQAAVKQLCRM
jgi:probable HAF family extracellular repeat protein